MCGRFTQFHPIEDFMEELEPDWDSVYASEEVPPSWNVAPSVKAWTAVSENNALAPKRMAWGFQPAWARDDMPKPINARVETASKKPYFKDAWRSSRCIVPIDSYYEWKDLSDGGKQPMCIYLADGSPMLLAGLHAQGRDEDPRCFAIVTTKASGKIAEVHHRKPLILQPDQARDWLAPDASKDDILRAATDSDQRELKWHPVSTEVNNPRNNGEILIREMS